MKRIISVAVTALLSLNLLSYTAAADNAPPLLENVTVYAEEVPPSGSLTIGADIWDGDGVEMSMLRFEHESGYRLDTSLTYTAGYGKAAERYSVVLKLPADAPEGVYTLVFASVTDKQLNRARYYPAGDPLCVGVNDMELDEQPSFVVRVGAKDPGKVESTAKRYDDSTPPELVSVRSGFVERVSSGTRWELFVEARDVIGTGDSEASGIGHITLWLRNKANGRTVSKVLTDKDLAGKVYCGVLEIGLHEPSGDLVLEQVTVTDRAFNRAVYCLPADIGDREDSKPLVYPIQLTLDNGSTQADSTAPTLMSVTPKKNRIATGETLYITAEAVDNLSGVQSVSLQLRSRSDKSITVLLTNRGSVLGGTVQSYQSRKPGSYRLTRATVTDYAGNRTSYYENPTGDLQPLTVTASFEIEER